MQCSRWVWSSLAPVGSLPKEATFQVPRRTSRKEADKDRLSAEHDYEVNLKAELEIMALHEKLDILREKQRNELISIQQEQLKLLSRLMEGQKEE